jgi:hypothetical protein
MHEPMRVWTVTDAPANFTPDYNSPPINEPAWFVFLPWFDGHDGACLRSSHVIAVSKADGRVLYDGSANDEG